MTSLWIILALLFGGTIGWFALSETPAWIEDVIMGALCLLVFVAGIDVGTNWHVIRGLIKKGAQVLLVPVFLTIGSLLGASLAVFILPIELKEALAVSAGVGWYTLAGPLITQVYGDQLGTIGLLSNMLRELLAFAMIPVVARSLGFMASIGPGGATTMDSTLPVIRRSTDSETAMIAFYNGFALSVVPPLLIPFFLSL